MPLPALGGLIPAALLLAAPVVVVESKVEQFRVAAKAAEARLSGALEVEPGAADLDARLKDASVVVAVGRKSLSAAREHAAGKPIVFCMVLGVGKADLAANVTGVPLEADPHEVLADIRAVLPHAKTVAVFFDPASSGLLIEHAREASVELGLELRAHAVSGGAAARDAVDALSGADVLWLPPDPHLYGRELSAYVLSTTLEKRMPLVGFLESYTQAGALGAVSPSYADEGDRAGKLAAELLARPEAARLPVPPPRYAPGELSLNLNTAHALGLEVPAAALSRAGAHVVR